MSLITIGFICSYALLSITSVLFVPYFILDSTVAIKQKVDRLKRNPLVYLYILFVIVQCVGLFYTQNMDYGIRRMITTLPLLFLPAIFLTERMSRRGFNTYLRISKYIVIVIFLALALIHVFLDERDLNTFVHFTVEDKLGVSQFYLIFVLLIPFLESIRQLGKRKAVVLNAIILALSFGFMFIFGNKTILLFLSIFILVFLFKGLKKKKAAFFKRLVLVAGLILFSTQVPIVKNRMAVLLKTTDFNMETIITKNSFTITKNTFEHRVLIDYIALNEITKSLPFGVGTGDVLEVLQENYKQLNFKAAISGDFNTHNQYLEEFLKTGILSGSLFLLIVAFLFKRTRRRQPFYVYYITIFAVACMVESYLVRQHGILIFGLFIPFFLTNDTE